MVPSATECRSNRPDWITRQGNGTISAGPLAAVRRRLRRSVHRRLQDEPGLCHCRWCQSQLDPTWQTNVFGSWMRFDAPGGAQFTVPATAATLAAGTAGTVTGIVDFNEYRVGTNTIWTPVKDFQIGAEILYTQGGSARPRCGSAHDCRWRGNRPVQVDQFRRYLGSPPAGPA